MVSYYVAVKNDIVGMFSKNVAYVSQDVVPGIILGGT